MYKDGVKHSGSPDAYSANDEVAALKAKNKVLTDALAAVHETAAKELKKKYDLVWFARYRCESVKWCKGVDECCKVLFHLLNHCFSISFCRPLPQPRGVQAHRGRWRTPKGDPEAAK